MASLLAINYTRNNRLLMAVGTAIAALLLAIIGVERGQTAVTGGAATSAKQALLFPYWSLKDGFASSIGMNNASDTVLTIYPTIYSANGAAIEVAPVTLGPRQQFAADLSRWIAEAGGAASGNEGSLQLRYEAPAAAYLGAQIGITNLEAGLSFDVPDEKPSAYRSSRLEGLWWQLDDASQCLLMITETTGNPVTVELQLHGGRGATGDLSETFSLAAHQTRVLHLSRLKPPFTTTPRGGRMGGVRISHTGEPGSVIAYGMLMKKSVGFSSHFRFTDPTQRQSDTLVGSCLFVGKADLPDYAAKTSFTAVAVFRNTADSPVEVSPVFTFEEDDKVQSVTLSRRQLTGQEIAMMDIGAELKQAGWQGPFRNAGLVLTGSDGASSIVGHLTCFDQTLNHTFDVPLKDPAVSSNRRGGSYPWSIEGDMQSLVHIRNTATEAARFTLQLDFAGGSYSLPMRELAPHQEATINLRQLRDEQVKDSLGRVIPLTVTGGQATWSERGAQAMIGRMQMYNAAAGVAMSLSCEIICCAPSSELVICAPGSFTGAPSDGVQVSLHEYQRRDCDGAQYGPFNVTGFAGWSSGNSNVATVAVGAVQLVGVGQATITANYTGSQFLFDPAVAVCEFSTLPMMATHTVAVRPRITIGITMFNPTSVSISATNPKSIGSVTISASPACQFDANCLQPGDFVVVEIIKNTVGGGFTYDPTAQFQNVTLSLGSSVTASFEVTPNAGTPTGMPPNPYSFTIRVADVRRPMGNNNSTSILQTVVLDPTNGGTAGQLTVLP